MPIKNLFYISLKSDPNLWQKGNHKLTNPNSLDPQIPDSCEPAPKSGSLLKKKLKTKPCIYKPSLNNLHSQVFKWQHFHFFFFNCRDTFKMHLSSYGFISTHRQKV